MQCKIKDRLYVVNLDKCESIGNHGISLYVNHDKVTYFDSFGVEYIPKEISISALASLVRSRKKKIM